MHRQIYRKAFSVPYFDFPIQGHEALKIEPVQKVPCKPCGFLAQGAGRIQKPGFGNKAAGRSDIFMVRIDQLRPVFMMIIPADLQHPIETVPGFIANPGPEILFVETQAATRSNRF